MKVTVGRLDPGHHELRQQSGWADDTVSIDFFEQKLESTRATSLGRESDWTSTSRTRRSRSFTMGRFLARRENFSSNTLQLANPDQHLAAC
jgi:hypothetical protein